MFVVSELTVTAQEDTMKKTLFMLIIILAVVGSGCAAKQEAIEQYPPDLRSQYINAIEKAAQSRATTIYWIKAPTNEEIESRISRSPKHS
jgi:hypothetical protein